MYFLAIAAYAAIGILQRQLRIRSRTTKCPQAPLEIMKNERTALLNPQAKYIGASNQVILDRQFRFWLCRNSLTRASSNEKIADLLLDIRRTAPIKLHMLLHAPFYRFITHETVITHETGRKKGENQERDGECQYRATERFQE